MHFKLTRQRGSAWVRRKREVLQQISVKDFNLLLPQWAVFESIESHLEGCSSSKLVIDLLIPRTRHHRLRAWLVCFDRCENQQVLQVPVLASLRSIASGASRYKNIRREKKPSIYTWSCKLPAEIRVVKDDLLQKLNQLGGEVSTSYLFEGLELSCRVSHTKELTQTPKPGCCSDNLLHVSCFLEACDPPVHSSKGML